jgi:hypothetical protein
MYWIMHSNSIISVLCLHQKIKMKISSVIEWISFKMYMTFVWWKKKVFTDADVSRFQGQITVLPWGGWGSVISLLSYASFCCTLWPLSWVLLLARSLCLTLSVGCLNGNTWVMYKICIQYNTIISIAHYSICTLMCFTIKLWYL